KGAGRQQVAPVPEDVPDGAAKGPQGRQEHANGSSLEELRSCSGLHTRQQSLRPPSAPSYACHTHEIILPADINHSTWSMSNRSGRIEVEATGPGRVGPCIARPSRG